MSVRLRPPAFYHLPWLTDNYTDSSKLLLRPVFIGYTVIGDSFAEKTCYFGYRGFRRSNRSEVDKCDAVGVSIRKLPTMKR